MRAKKEKITQQNKIIAQHSPSDAISRKEELEGDRKEELNGYRKAELMDTKVANKPKTFIVMDSYRTLRQRDSKGSNRQSPHLIRAYTMAGHL